ncbi:unnamed protein product, partial [marine sediment metagenome]
VGKVLYEIRGTTNPTTTNTTPKMALSRVFSCLRYFTILKEKRKEIAPMIKRQSRAYNDPN